MIKQEKLLNPAQNSTRQGFGDGIVEAAHNNKNVVALTADLAESVKLDDFKKEHPEKFFEMGIAEQDMIGTASGLAIKGKIPFATTFSIFASGRAWDQIRNTVCHSNLNVKIVGSHGGITVGEDGASHQALEDLSVLRPIPNLIIVVPCDYMEAKRATVQASNMQGPVYLRIGRPNIAHFTDESTPFTIGLISEFRKGSDVTIVACGIMVYEAMMAAIELEKENISCRVLNCHTIKPIDEEPIIRAAKETGAIVTAEEHMIIGGLGSAVCEVLAGNHPVPIERVGVKNTFGESGKTEELKEKYGLTKRDIVESVKKVLKRK